MSLKRKWHKQQAALKKNLKEAAPVEVAAPVEETAKPKKVEKVVEKVEDKKQEKPKKVSPTTPKKAKASDE